MRAADGGQEDVPTTEVDEGLQAVMGFLCRVILKLIISWTATCRLQVRMGPIVATKMVWKALLFFNPLKQNKCSSKIKNKIYL